MRAAARSRRALLCAVALVLPVLVGVQAQAAAPVLVSAHRGGAAYAPENTMLAFANAVRIGADQLETDVQQTADGTLVLIHDDTLDRTTSCTGTVSTTTDAALARCDAAWWWTAGPNVTTADPKAPHVLRGKGVKVPRLAELLDYARSLGAKSPQLSLEIKDIPGESNFDPAGTRIAPLLVAAIAKSGVPKDRFVVQSFWPAAIDAVKRLDPALRTQFLTTTSTGQTAGQNLTYTVVGRHDISAPNHDAPDFGAPLVTAAHSAGKAVIPYTADTSAHLTRAVTAGVDGVITNRPACLLGLLKRKAPKQLLPALAVKAGSAAVTACAE